MDTTLEALQAELPRLRQTALEHLGEAVVVQAQHVMRHAYARPVLRSGALLASVHWQQDGPHAICLVSALPYAAAVHNGTRHMPGRPFLTDAVTGDREPLRRAIVQALKETL